MPKHLLKYEIQGDKLILYKESDPGNVILVPYTGSPKNDLSEAVCQLFEGNSGEIFFRAENIEDGDEFQGVWAHNRPRIFNQPSP